MADSSRPARGSRLDQSGRNPRRHQRRPPPYDHGCDAEAVEKYRSSNGSLPKATDIVGLTDILHPKYMSDLVREDGWGNPIIYAVTGPSAFRLVSHGADALPGTRDDIVVSSGSTAGQ